MPRDPHEAEVDPSAIPPASPAQSAGPEAESTTQRPEGQRGKERRTGHQPGSDWYRSPWLVPAAGVLTIAFTDVIGGATATLRVATVALGLTSTFLAATACTSARTRSVVGTVLVAATAAALVTLDLPSVQRL